MGVFAGPEITESGLVLSLDAANNKSILSAVEVLVVAGGGGGGGSHGAAGGGGAGGLVYHSAKSVTTGPISVIVGSGGQGGRYYGASTTGNYGASNNSHGFQGGNSSFGDITAIGGGGGNEAFYTDSIYKNGGSGGGAGDYYFGVANPAASRGGLATQTDSGGGIGYGFPGGSRGPGGPTTAEDVSHAIPHEGSGGGGAGGTATGGGPSQPSNGGIGRFYSQFINAGSPAGWFAGGGGGGYYYYGPYTSTNAPDTDTGFKGGGGRGCNGNTNYDAQDGGTYARGRGTTAGAPNTGGGGGGGSGNNTTPNAPDGGSGIVIVRYPGSQRATGGTVTSVGGHTIHTFTTSGTFTPNFGDLSGNGNTGTFTTGVTYDSANGGSLSFDGGDASHIQIVNTAGQLDFPGDFTVSLWIYPTQYHRTYQTMIDTYPGGATNGWIFTTMYSGSQVISWYTEGSSWQPSGTAVTLNAWNHVVASRIGTTVKLYKNATEIHSHSDSSNIRGGVGRIGKGLSDGSDYGNIFGRISNVQIYKGKGLTAAEVSQNFNATRSRYSI